MGDETRIKGIEKEFLGMVLQMAGISAVVGGTVLSFQYWPAGVALISGFVAYMCGAKLVRA